MSDLPHLRLLEPAPGLLAWYDGRVPGYLMYPGPNWVDDGAIELGIATYALVEGPAAVIYDSHVSPAHAERMKADLAARGVTDVTVVLSHRHLDHVAGTAAFAGAPVIACRRTAEGLAADRDAIEAGTLHGRPAISPLVLPDRVFDDRMDLRLGDRPLELIRFDILSDDGTVLWDPARRLLLAGDTLEDPVTYVSAPEDLATHLTELDRLAALRPVRILPNHGDPARIAAGGYGPGLIDATRRYIAFLLGLRDHPDRADLPLEQVIGADLAGGHLVWFDAYRAVHADNVAKVLGHG